MTNRLATETSPYLLQHADNPVAWYPWGTEAIQKARDEDKPIFLSIGYSACHWCHVMAHESFEDPHIARWINEHFVAIKVDREEHPELDAIYMEAVQMLMGHGGWPMSVFLTPQLEPFFGGTYWPPRARSQMPGFDQVLRAIVDVWNHRRGEAVEQAGKLTMMLRESVLTDTRDRGTEKLGGYLLEEAYAALSRGFDPHNGGFGEAPKFPHPMAVQLLLRRWRREGQEPVLNMVRLTLDRMAAGGIYDQLGGGFHRYSTDDRWLVPHFEKMLYDNALLAGCYLEAWQATQERRYARIAGDTLDYVLRDMTDPEGGYFFSSEDADSEGGEGRFYLWTLDEVRQVVGRERADAFAYVYDVTESGNFEGRNILNMPKTLEPSARILRRDMRGLEAELGEDRCKLFGAREQRPRPGKDDKLLVSWNGLMIEALARAGSILDEPRYTQAAERAAEFLLGNLLHNGRLYHTWRRGRASIEGFLEDYASLANALVTLYEGQFHERWIDQAVWMADHLLRRFADPDGGGFYTTAADHDTVLVRKKEVLDSSLPSGGGLAAMALLRLGKLCGRADYRQAAEDALRNAVPLMAQAPLGTAQMLLALDAYLGPTPEVVILGFHEDQATRAVLGELHHRFIPNKIVAFRDMATSNGSRSQSLAAIFADKRPIIPGPTVFICENFTCQAPVTGKDAALAAVNTLAAARV